MLVEKRFASEPGWVGPLGLTGITPRHSTSLGAMFHEDSLNVLKAIPGDSIDPVMTSPPFALTRKKEYGNEPIERYLDWFLPFCREIRRCLKPGGSFVLDIGGAWIPGAPVRSVYHFELAVRLATSEEWKRGGPNRGLDSRASDDTLVSRFQPATRRVPPDTE